MSAKSKKPTRPRCHLGGYATSTTTDGRPSFSCTRCGHTWSCGKSGGMYLRPSAPKADLGGEA